MLNWVFCLCFSVFNSFQSYLLGVNVVCVETKLNRTSQVLIVVFFVVVVVFCVNLIKVIYIQPKQFLKSCKPSKMRENVIYVHHLILYMALKSVMQGLHFVLTPIVCVMRNQQFQVTTANAKIFFSNNNLSPIIIHFSLDESV